MLTGRLDGCVRIKAQESQTKARFLAVPRRIVSIDPLIDATIVRLCLEPRGDIPDLALLSFFVGVYEG